MPQTGVTSLRLIAMSASCICEYRWPSLDYSVTSDAPHIWCVNGEQSSNCLRQLLDRDHCASHHTALSVSCCAQTYTLIAEPGASNQRLIQSCDLTYGRDWQSLSELLWFIRQVQAGATTVSLSYFGTTILLPHRSSGCITDGAIK